jgi:hypothetical protein
MVHELVNAKLIMLSDVGGALGAGLEACVSLIRVKVDAHDDAGGLRCRASGVHPQHLDGRRRSTPGGFDVESFCSSTYSPARLFCSPPMSWLGLLS